MDSTPLPLDEILEGLTQALPLVGIILTPDGEFVDVIANPETEDLLYAERETLVGKSLFDVFPDELADQFATTIETALQTGNVQREEYQLPVKTGGTKHFQGHVAPIPTDEEHDPYVIWIAEDITARKESERQLRRYQQAVEAASVAVYITDVDGRIEYVNPAFEEITGYGPQEAIGESTRILKSGEMPDSYYEELWETLLSGDVWEEEVVNRRSDGELYYAYQTIAPIRDAAGEIEAFIAVQRDITDRIELEQERQREHEHLVRTENLAAVGGWEYVPATETARWTEGTRRIFDVAAEDEPTIEEASEFFHPDDRAIMRDAFDQCLESGISYSVDLRIITARGRQRWVHLRGERVRENGETKLVGVIQDITDHKMDEQRLMVLNRVLRHNLRNKLNAIMGYAEVIETQYPENSMEFFHHIEKSAEALLSLAEKSRQSNKILEYDYTTEPVALEPLLANLCTECRENYPDATIENDLLDVTVSGNETGMRLLFDELLENALKHNDQAQPTVTVTVSLRSDRRVAITIADDGPGLPEMERKVLKTGEETALIHSDGIGLWTTNWLVTKLSGGIDVGSNSPRGTRITITLPIVRPE